MQRVDREPDQGKLPVTGPYSESWKRRIKLALECRDNPKAQAIQLVRCARDPFYWWDNFVTTYDPRLSGSGARIPFDLFPQQRELVQFLFDRLEKQEEGLIEKSRDMGWTWIACGFVVWHWLFQKNFKATFGSRKEELVDRIGNPDSIFGKIRMLFDGLPKWMLPPNFAINGKYDNHRLIINPNPNNGNTIVGEAGDEMGRGGRGTIYIIDEAAFIDHAESVEAAVSSHARCRIWASSVNGMGNLFAKKRHGGSLQPHQIFRLHYTDHPHKDEAWAKKTKKELVETPWIWASEHEIDYSASVEGVCIPGPWVQSARILHDRLKLSPSGPGIAGLDVGGGKSQSVFCARFGPLIMPPIGWGNGDTTATSFTALDHAVTSGVSLVNFDEQGLGKGVVSTLSLNTRPGVKTVPINTGNPATWMTTWADGRNGRQKFGNLKAEIWWIMRERFRCTHEHIAFLEGDEEGLEHDLSELILLPKCTELQVQLSIPKRFINNAGKIIIESKTQLEVRGVKSPDFAEALSLTFVPADAPPVIAIPIVETISRSWTDFASITQERGW